MSKIMAIASAFAFVVSISFNASAQPAPTDCKTISDSLERLRCYDGQATQTAPPETTVTKPKPPVEDPFISKAKTRVKQQLRDPDSARFQDVKVKVVGGKKVVCGLINAKNSMGGMTGTHPFAYDGEHAYLGGQIAERVFGLLQLSDLNFG
jgi:hypothetical protein